MKKTERNSSRLNVILVAALMTVSTGALADKEYSDRKHNRNVENTFDFAKVLNVTPVYREVRSTTPVEECWQEPVTRTQTISHGSHSAGGTLAGGLIGGIIGHQFGKGRGQKLATAVGTIVGAQIGHDSMRGARANSHKTYTSYERFCEVQNQVNYEEVLDSYRVTYRYKGNQYQTSMPYDPGKKIKVRISVEPVI